MANPHLWVIIIKHRVVAPHDINPVKCVAGLTRVNAQMDHRVNININVMSAENLVMGRTFVIRGSPTIMVS